MFTPAQLRDLARACRALAHTVGETAKKHEGTTVYERTLAEQKKFQELAKTCEDLAKR